MTQLWDRNVNPALGRHYSKIERPEKTRLTGTMPLDPVVHTLIACECVMRRSDALLAYARYH